MSHALKTDFYQLTMMYAYFAADMGGEVTFEYFVRKLPRRRRFMIYAGLQQAVEYLQGLGFNGDQIDFLRQTPTFATVGDAQTRERFFEWLRQFKFTGTVRAAAEGTAFFPNEPMLQVTGDLLQCQLIETYLLSIMNYQTLVATKAARVRLAAGDRTLIDFGTRRAHGPGAGVLAARGAFVGGFNGTSNVEAAFEMGIPPVGTAAHAYTMAFEQEEAAFAHYLKTFPETTTLLIDTYDTIRGAHRAAALGKGVKGVRLDSGDLGALAVSVRKILDDAGLPDARIVASNDLNELKIKALVGAGAPIDVYGVGTELVTSRDDPTLSGVYKLVEKEVDGQRMPAMKLASSKPSYPGRKDFHRGYDAQGRLCAGILTQHGEAPEAVAGVTRTEQMLQTVLEGGKAVGARPSLSDIQANTLANLEMLPQTLRALDGALEDHPIGFHVSPRTHKLIQECRARYKAG